MPELNVFVKTTVLVVLTKTSKLNGALKRTDGSIEDVVLV